MNIFIVHGFKAGIDDHWFPWLSQELAEHNVIRIALPNSLLPQRQAWLDALSAEIGIPDDNTVIITHSLGGYTALKYLENLTTEWSLAGLILVSGFLGDITTQPHLHDLISEVERDTLRNFVAEDVDPARLIPHIASISMIHSDNDIWVPPQASIDLAHKLHAHISEVPGAGHFLGDEGYTTLPEVLTEIRKALCADCFDSSVATTT